VERHEQLQPHRFARAYYGFFPTADGTIAIAAGGRVNHLRVLKALNLEDRWVTEPGWVPDDATAHVEQIYTQVVGVLRTRPTAYWLDVLKKCNVPASPLKLVEEQLDDEQAWENGFFVRLEHEVVGGMTVVAPPVRFSETPLEAEHASPPLGRDSRAILREAGLSDAEVDALVAQGGVRATSADEEDDA
jgi:crotonobetainyl-CoA:carnitine CoA-transferase CaiB-like acyl-CoA transferase